MNRSKRKELTKEIKDIPRRYRSVYAPEINLVEAYFSERFDEFKLVQTDYEEKKLDEALKIFEEEKIENIEAEKTKIGKFEEINGKKIVEIKASIDSLATNDSFYISDNKEHIGIAKAYDGRVYRNQMDMILNKFSLLEEWVKATKNIEAREKIMHHLQYNGNNTYNYVRWPNSSLEKKEIIEAKHLSLEREAKDAMIQVRGYDASLNMARKLKNKYETLQEIIEKEKILWGMNRRVFVRDFTNAALKSDEKIIIKGKINMQEDLPGIDILQYEIKGKVVPLAQRYLGDMWKIIH